MDNTMKLCDLLRTARKKGGLTQAQVAKAIGCSTQNYGYYERGLRNPKPETMKKISQAILVPGKNAFEAGQLAGFYFKDIFFADQTQEEKEETKKFIYDNLEGCSEEFRESLSDFVSGLTLEGMQFLASIMKTIGE